MVEKLVMHCIVQKPCNFEHFPTKYEWVMSVQRRIRTYLDTWGIVIDNIENVDEAKENGDEETHPASNYLQI